MIFILNNSDKMAATRTTIITYIMMQNTICKNIENELHAYGFFLGTNPED